MAYQNNQTEDTVQQPNKFIVLVLTLNYVLELYIATLVSDNFTLTPYRIFTRDILNSTYMKHG
jgi:hypothetical protein